MAPATSLSDCLHFLLGPEEMSALSWSALVRFSFEAGGYTATSLAGRFLILDFPEEISVVGIPYLAPRSIYTADGVRSILPPVEDSLPSMPDSRRVRSALISSGGEDGLSRMTSTRAENLGEGMVIIACDG